MISAGPLAVTGTNGRLGSAIVACLKKAGRDVRPWSRPDYDLDDAEAPARLVQRDHPVAVIHCAAWTDVDGCARDPATADRRNAWAVRDLADACVRGGAGLVYISTNEVFDGKRADGNGYTESDIPRPINAYGASKLQGERQANAVFGSWRPSAPARQAPKLWIVRTAWIYGPPGNDFLTKILSAADRLLPGEPLPVVSDEVGSPTYSRDLADGLVRLVFSASPGLYHLAGSGAVSRSKWAEEIFRLCRRSRQVSPILRKDYLRASMAPGWAVLDSGRAARAGIALQRWEAATAEYGRELCPG